jgi:hypothetical protein
MNRRPAPCCLSVSANERTPAATRESAELAIYIGNASVRFKLDRLERSTRRGSKSAAEPREKLCLTVTDAPELATSWADNDGLLLERQITDVIVGMLVASELQHRRWIQQQAEWERERREEEVRAAIRRKEEEVRQERERLAAIEEAKRDRLLKDAEAWRKANNLRDYVRAVCNAASKLASAPELEVWSHWALREADRLDPISSGKAIERLTFDATSFLSPREAVEAEVEWEES